MGFSGRLSKACELCRTRRTKVNITTIESDVPDADVVDSAINNDPDAANVLGNTYCAYTETLPTIYFATRMRPSFGRSILVLVHMV